MSQPKFITLKLSYQLLRGGTILPPRVGLQIGGPIVEIQIGLHQHLVKLLQSKGEAIPEPITGDAIIDTGASVTTINTSVANSLQLPQSGKVVSIGIGGTSTGFTAGCTINIKGLNVNVPRAHCHDLPNNLVALIGRDILTHMIVVYNGISGTVELRLLTPPPIKPKARKSTNRHKKPRKRKKKR